MFCCAFASICVFVYFITASDYYHFSELLTPEEQAVRKRVREFMEKEVAPIMTEVCLSLCLFFFYMWMEDSFFNLVGLIRVMAVLATSQPIPLQQQRYLELMQAVGLLIWSLAWRRFHLKT
ncbi:hypothetical protein YC2023_068320 [Brassica napus]